MSYSVMILGQTPDADTALSEAAVAHQEAVTQLDTGRDEKLTTKQLGTLDVATQDSLSSLETATDDLAQQERAAAENLRQALAPFIADHTITKAMFTGRATGHINLLD